jgi:GDP-L-fucose synthase
MIAAAARVGGIAANAGRPAEFISDDLRIEPTYSTTPVAKRDRFLFPGYALFLGYAAA